MATLVLSTVGSALGGPVGGAIGALLGQSIDQQVLGAPRRGPRLGDLDVQTSSYGTQIPRIYGSMRVAGSVVWATDLVESEHTTGAKGQPDVTYSYSASLAVALSSRNVAAIGRIWADGQLLRGAAGDLKVPGTFRFYDGSESQAIDPLIGSIEGIANTPAYRGLAVAVFENLELATYGNRIPFLTFEVIADPGSVPIAAILADASDGAIDCDTADEVEGYAAYGRSVASAVEPLVSAFAVQLFDDGAVVRGPATREPIAIEAGDLANSAVGEKREALERERLAPDAVPTTLRLSYYDPDRDYQAGEARALAAEQIGREALQDLPAVLSASAAKALAHRIVSRQWSDLDRLTLRLPVAHLGVEPGAVVHPNFAAGSWVVEKATIEGFGTIAELRRQFGGATGVTADPGRSVSARDVVEAAATLALIDIPDLTQSASASPILLVAASSPSDGWRRRALSVSGAGSTISAMSGLRKAVLGRSSTRLSDSDPYLIDTRSSVEVELIDGDQWLTSCDDGALGSGTNMAVLGAEIIQFGSAEPLGNGKFRLTRLLRGRGGTEWAASSHEAEETFCLLDRTTISALEVSATAAGATLIVTDDKGATEQAIFRAESVRPLAPVFLKASYNPQDGLTIDWIRRSCLGFGWLDEVDAPLGESREQYRVTCTGGAGVVEWTSDRPMLSLEPGEVGALGTGPIRIEVRQVGDWSASRPATAMIELLQE